MKHTQMLRVLLGPRVLERKGYSMKRVIALFGLVGLALALGLVDSTPALAGPKLVVDDDGVQCPGAGFTTIQAAVSAAASLPGTPRDPSLRRNLSRECEYRIR